MNELTGKEIVNLIDKLREESIDDTKIIEIIKYIVLNNPKSKESNNN